MAELRLNGEMNLLSTRYRVSSDCACRFKRQKWMVEVLRETSSDIGRIGLTGEKRELLLHMSPPGLSPGAQSIGDKQRALQQGLADKEKRHILQKLTQIGGVQRYKDELRQALAGI